MKTDINSFPNFLNKVISYVDNEQHRNKIPPSSYRTVLDDLRFWKRFFDNGRINVSIRASIMYSY